MRLSCIFGHDYGPRRVGGMLVLSYCRRCDAPMDERNPWQAPPRPQRHDEPLHQDAAKERESPQ